MPGGRLLGRCGRAGCLDVIRLTSVGWSVSPTEAAGNQGLARRYGCRRDRFRMDRHSPAVASKVWGDRDPPTIALVLRQRTIAVDPFRGRDRAGKPASGTRNCALSLPPRRGRSAVRSYIPAGVLANHRLGSDVNSICAAGVLERGTRCPAQNSTRSWESSADRRVPGSGREQCGKAVGRQLQPDRVRIGSSGHHKPAPGPGRGSGAHLSPPLGLGARTLNVPADRVLAALAPVVPH